MGSSLKSPHQLNCIQISSRDWDMAADGIVHASLRFDNMFGSRAVAETVNGRWTFKRNGFFNTWVSARKAGNETDIAKVNRKGWGGAAEVSLLAGPKYSWRRTKRVRGEWGLYDVRERLLLSEIFKRKFFKVEGSVTVEAAGKENGDIPMLVLLCWYWLVLRDLDEQSSAGAVIVAMG